MLNPGLAIPLLWLIWMISWFAAARWTNQTTGRVSFKEQLPYHLLMLAGIICFMVPMDGIPRLWPVHLIGAWICADRKSVV